MTFFCGLYPLQELQAQQISSGDGNWHTLHTPHFQIHHRTRNRAYALRVGLLAEKIHARLEPFYKSRVQTTHIVIIFETDTVNAFATTFGFDQIVLFLEPPRLGEFSRFDRWVEMLLTHEYTHVLSLRYEPSRGNGFWYYLLGIPPNHLAPQGFIEGTAVWEESKQGKGRLHDPLTQMVVRTAILTDNYPSLGEMLTGSHRWPGGRMVYLYGSRYVDEMAQLNGNAAVAAFWNSKALPVNPQARMPYRFGLKPTYKSMHKKDEAIYTSQIKELRKRGLSRVERLTVDGGSKEFLTFNDQDELLFFARPLAALPGLFRMDPETGTRSYERRQKRSGGIAEAGGVRIYSEDYSNFPDFGLRYELYNGASFFLNRIAPDRSIAYPDLSKDGSRLVFIERDETKRYLKVVSIQHGRMRDEKTIFEVQYDGILQFATIAPDGTQAAALIRPGASNYAALALCKLSLSGNSACKPILKTKGIITQPRFSANGQNLIFASDADGIYNIYQINIATHKVIRLTRTLTGMFYPAPSAQGDLYAMQYFQEGYDIIRIRKADLMAEPIDLFNTPAGWQDLIAESGEDDSKTLKPGQSLPEDWRESSYWGLFEIKPFLMGFVGTISAVNLGVRGRDPLLRHQFLAGIGASTPDPVAVVAYDYTRYSIGFNAMYFTNYWKRDRNPGCINENDDPLRFLCDDTYSFEEEARAYLRYTGDGRYFAEQIMLGYAHRKLRNARRIRQVEYEARDLNLSGPSLAILMGDTHHYFESVSPEHGWRLFLSSDYYTRPESKDQLEKNNKHLIEYGVAEGGLSLYLPSFWENHVNYFSGFGYGSYGPDRAVQKVRLNRFVRGINYKKAPSDHTAAVGTYEYRLPLIWYSGSLSKKYPGVMLRNLAMSVFADYGAVFDRQVYKENWVLGYGVSFSFGLNLAYLSLPELKVTFARGTGPAGEGQVYLSFNAELSSIGSVRWHNRKDNETILEPYHHTLPGFSDQPGYFRDRRAGGVLE